MNFFRDQERARRNTQWLILFFILAVGLIVAVLYLLFAVLLKSKGGTLWEPRLLLMVGGGVVSLIGGASFHKTMQLASGGGSAVAEAMGARRVTRDSTDRLEQRLLNIVDEMAIASGITVPQVYIMDRESGINAFAAGSQPSEAVVAVTRGCLEQLNRDELQGVVAHEFSHIFNGDMRLNLRLMGVLFGILVIAIFGRVMMRASLTSSSRRRNSDDRARVALAALGLAMFCIGYIGVFFGELIKAAVSRQREFLADAAAVQFTRNPQGIAGALKKIAGYHLGTTVTALKAEEASHMFFARAVSGWFNTHPPLEARIARIEPAFRVMAPSSTSSTGGSPGAAPHVAAMGFAITPDAVRDSIGVTRHEHLEYAHQLLEQLPKSIHQALHEPRQAASVLYALLVTPESDPETVLQQNLESSDDTMGLQVLSHLPWIKDCSRGYWLPLVELALPALRELKQDEQLAILDNVQALARADGKINLFEFALLAIVEQQLGDKPRKKTKRPALNVITEDLNLLLSLLARAGKKSRTEVDESFAAAVALAPLKANWKLLQPKSVGLAQLADLLDRLNTLTFGFKGKVIEACTAAIIANGHVALVEAELLRAIGARLECPVPPLQVGRIASTA